MSRRAEIRRRRKLGINPDAIKRAPRRRPRRVVVGEGEGTPDQVIRIQAIEHVRLATDDGREVTRTSGGEEACIVVYRECIEHHALVILTSGGRWHRAMQAAEARREAPALLDATVDGRIVDTRDVRLLPDGNTLASGCRRLHPDRMPPGCGAAITWRMHTAPDGLGACIGLVNMDLAAIASVVMPEVRTVEVCR